jgi:hypothetical protein
MNPYKIKTWTLLILAAGLLGAAGCSRGVYVYVQQDKYSPQLHQNLAVYKGATLYLTGFTNRAENTSAFYYYSPDYGVTYEGAPSLQSYLWYCFQKAFVSLGMQALSEDDNPPPEVPEVQIGFTSLTDQEFKFEVTVLRAKQEVYKNSYAIAAPPPKDLRPMALEERAYRMVDAAVSALLFDQRFQQALY